jgi:hypothetical protein
MAPPPIEAVAMRPRAATPRQRHVWVRAPVSSVALHTGDPASGHDLGSGWLMGYGSVGLYPQTPSVPTRARTQAEEDRVASAKAADRHRPAQHDRPVPADPTEPPVGAAAAPGGGGVAPPALACATFAALGVRGGDKYRCLCARLLMPDAPGVPSLRDRPG